MFKGDESPRGWFSAHVTANPSKTIKSVALWSYGLLDIFSLTSENLIEVRPQDPLGVNLHALERDGDELVLDGGTELEHEPNV